MDDRCRQILSALHRFLDGECPRALEEAMRTHLSDCDCCHDRAAFERALRALLACTCRDAAPDGLAQRIRAVVRTPPVS